MLDETRRLIVAGTMGMLGLAAAGFVPAAAQEKFKAVTTFTVIADMAKNVAGDAAIVESITKPGAEIHNYAPTPGDIKRAQGAKLILWNGLNLELWFERFFQNLRDVPFAVVSEGVEPMGISEGPYTGKPNPHAWMSPENALVYVDNIRDAFVQHDPQSRGLQAMPKLQEEVEATIHADPREARQTPRTSAGWSRARGRSAIWRAISA